MGLMKSIVNFFKPEDDVACVQRPGRNEACWCGSGKKYKKCHLSEDEEKQSRRYTGNCGAS